VGLVGGSFARAQKASACTGTVVGIGRGRLNLEEAVNLGIIDRFVPLDGDWAAEVTGADFVLLAAPVAQYPALLRAMAPHLGPHTIVTDAGSTKQDVIAAARETLGSVLAPFVSGSPIGRTRASG